MGEQLKILVVEASTACSLCTGTRAHAPQDGSRTLSLDNDSMHCRAQALKTKANSEAEARRGTVLRKSGARRARRPQSLQLCLALAAHLLLKDLA